MRGPNGTNGFTGPVGPKGEQGDTGKNGPGDLTRCSYSNRTSSSGSTPMDITLLDTHSSLTVRYTSSFTRTDTSFLVQQLSVQQLFS